MKFTKLFIPVLLVFFALNSCSNDDDSPSVENNNFLKINNTEYQLKAGVIEDYGSYEGDLYNFDITLINSEITIIDGEPAPTNDVITGIYFELFTNSEDDLALGEYTKVDFENVGNQTFEISEIFINSDINSDETNPSYMVDGSFKVLSDGPEYEFEFSGVDNQGQSISGYYKGELTYVDVMD